MLRLIAILAACLLPWCIGCRGPQPETESEEPPASASAAVLRSLPYASQVPLARGDEREGVVLHHADDTNPGHTLTTMRHLPSAFLLDMEGRTQHRWSHGRIPWQHAHMLPDGGLLAVVKDLALLRLDRDSNLLWQRKGRFHHEVNTTDDGRVVSAIRRMRTVIHRNEPLPILEDCIVVLSAEGELLREIPLYPLFGSYIGERQATEIRALALAEGWPQDVGPEGPEGELLTLPDTPPDVFHLNAVTLLERNLPDVAPAGSFLVSIRQLNLVAAIDAEGQQLLWRWGPGELQRQHHPTVLDNGHLLIFDNGVRRGSSRILELDPRSEGIVWEYRDPRPEGFYSESRGSSQRLTGGNTLITESDRGRLFEVTPEGRVVWELYSPLIPNAEVGKPASRAAIYRSWRYFEVPWLEAS